MKLFFLPYMMIGIIILSSQSSLAAPGVDEIISLANKASYYQGKDGKAKVDMTITDKQGRQRNRKFTILRKNKDQSMDQLFYVYFHQPADVRKMVFLVWKQVEKDDDRWLYLPALDLVKRIASSDKRSSFVGSDFLYEDVSGRNPKEDLHELIKEENDFYLIKGTPKKKDTVEFAYYKVWINKSNYLPFKAEYYKEGNTLYRTVKSLETKEVEGFPTIVKSEVKNLEKNSTTILSFSNVAYNINLKEKIFTERYLRRAPKEARK